MQRIPVTESDGRVHTSTATVAILPQPEEVTSGYLITDATVHYNMLMLVNCKYDKK